MIFELSAPKNIEGH